MFDLDIFESTPKDKFLECLKHGNLGALERYTRKLIAQRYAMMDMLEAMGKTQSDLKAYMIENDESIQSRMDDFYIEFMANVYGAEG